MKEKYAAPRHTVTMSCQRTGRTRNQETPNRGMVYPGCGERGTVTFHDEKTRERKYSWKKAMSEYTSRNGDNQLPERVATSLRACYTTTGNIPTATRYGKWRNTLTPEQKAATPSITAVVPIAFPSWRDAREAAGIEEGKIRESHGPKPTWSADDCWTLVQRWISTETGPHTFARYNHWVQQQRDTGADIPSVSTVRLRLRRPWSSIVTDAKNKIEEK